LGWDMFRDLYSMVVPILVKMQVRPKKIEPVNICIANILFDTYT